MADFTFNGFELHAKQQGIAIFENLEDLGAMRTSSGENFGVRPASMWQWEQVTTLLQLEQVTTQLDFGTDYLKPTRLLLANVDNVHEAFCKGQPCFDDQGFYTGPLQARSAQRQLVGAAGSVFATTGSEQWPSSFCEWGAQTILEKIHCATVRVLPSLKMGARQTQTGLTSPFYSRMGTGTNFLEEVDSPDNVSNLVGKDFSMTGLDSPQWGGGTLTREFGVKMFFGRSCGERH